MVLDPLSMAGFEKKKKHIGMFRTSAARVVSKTSIGWQYFCYLERVVAETSTLTQHMAWIGRAAEHREPWAAKHQLLCRELRSCIIFSTQCLLPASIPLPFRIAALVVNSQRLRNPRIVIPCVLLAVWFVRAVTRSVQRQIIQAAI